MWASKAIKVGYKWKIGNERLSNPGRKFGLVIIIQLLNIGRFTLLLINKPKLFQNFGMVPNIDVLLEELLQEILGMARSISFSEMGLVLFGFQNGFPEQVSSPRFSEKPAPKFGQISKLVQTTFWRRPQKNWAREDHFIYQFESKGVYSSKFLYTVTTCIFARFLGP